MTIITGCKFSYNELLYEIIIFAIIYFHNELTMCHVNLNSVHEFLDSSLQNFSIENCDIHCTCPIIDYLFIDN